MKRRRVLVLGDSSFAARGLIPTLESAGFSATGHHRSVNQSSLDLSSAHGSFDAVVNFVLIKAGNIADNIEYIDNVAAFCKKNAVRHLIHISSPSSLETASHQVNESTPLETNPERKGRYGSIKAAADLRLMQTLPEDIRLTMLMPGFILGNGMTNPIAGMAIRLPWNRLLVIGNARAQLPVTTRLLLHRAIVKALRTPPNGRETLLLVDPRSPTLREYLAACCEYLGCGKGTIALPPLIWWWISQCGRLGARLTGIEFLKSIGALTGRVRRMSYSSEKSGRRLEMTLRVDWRRELQLSLEGQSRNFTLPERPATPLPTTKGPITLFGLGGIVRKKYLPSLRRWGYESLIRAYDVMTGMRDGEVAAQPIATAQVRNGCLAIVATPGSEHIEALSHLRLFQGTVLVEKPLCYSRNELSRWLSFAKARSQPVLVCHNYRFKRNTVEMLSVLRRFNPGRLLHVSVDFHSPDVQQDQARWRRDERTSQTLLLDYGLHFLDLACMFCSGPWDLIHVDSTRNVTGATSYVSGRAVCNGVDVDFVLRQGFAPRRARIAYTFQNYTAVLGFFPDHVGINMNDLNGWQAIAELRDEFRGIVEKLGERIFRRDSDHSHEALLAHVLEDPKRLSTEIGVAELRGFYDLLFDIAKHVYR